MNGETNVEQIQIIDSNKHVGETVKIGAWIANHLTQLVDCEASCVIA